MWVSSYIDSWSCVHPNSHSRNIFIISYYKTSFKVRIWLNHFGWWKNWEFFLVNILNFLKNTNFISMSGRFLCLLLILWLGLFNIEKMISKFWRSISRSKERWRSYICIPSEAQTQIIAHTKGKLWARLSNPFLCRKPILKTIKSFSFAD